MDCVFCKILAGDIPAFKVCEDEHTLAFMDINPAAPGHLLIIPQEHCENLFDAQDEMLARVMATARRVARAMRDSLGADSLNLLQANGPWALQSVPHFHLHLIPRRQNDGLGLEWPLRPADPEQIRKVANAVRDVLA